MMEDTLSRKKNGVVLKNTPEHIEVAPDVFKKHLEMVSRQKRINKRKLSFIKEDPDNVF